MEKRVVPGRVGTRFAWFDSFFVPCYHDDMFKQHDIMVSGCGNTRVDPTRCILYHADVAYEQRDSVEMVNEGVGAEDGRCQSRPMGRVVGGEYAL